MVKQFRSSVCDFNQLFMLMHTAYEGHIYVELLDIITKLHKQARTFNSLKLHKYENIPIQQGNFNKSRSSANHET